MNLIVLVVTCTLSVFLPMVDLNELDMQDSSVYPRSHEHNFKLTTSCIVK